MNNEQRLLIIGKLTVELINRQHPQRDKTPPTPAEYQEFAEKIKMLSIGHDDVIKANRDKFAPFYDESAIATGE